jgi:hypothetical protein
LDGRCLNQHWTKVHELHHQGEDDDAQCIDLNRGLNNPNSSSVYVRRRPGH